MFRMKAFRARSWLLEGKRAVSPKLTSQHKQFCTGKRRQNMQNPWSGALTSFLSRYWIFLCFAFSWVYIHTKMLMLMNPETGYSFLFLLSNYICLKKLILMNPLTQFSCIFPTAMLLFSKTVNLNESINWIFWHFSYFQAYISPKKLNVD